MLNRNSDTVNSNNTVGLFGKKYPKGYKYKITTETERQEVMWLISQGDFKSVLQYETFMTKVLLNKTN